VGRSVASKAEIRMDPAVKEIKGLGLGPELGITLNPNPCLLKNLRLQVSLKFSTAKFSTGKFSTAPLRQGSSVGFEATSISEDDGA